MAIGTGWPFAINLLNEGIDVYGSDIADFLVEGIKSHYPEIKVTVASYEDLGVTEVDQYDVVYCFRSTWYFPNVLKAIDAMLKLAKKPGWVIFDIMNQDSKYVRRMIIVHRLLIPYTIFKNFGKLSLNLLFKKDYLMQDPWNIHEIPVFPKLIENHLDAQGVAYKKYFTNQIAVGVGSESGNKTTFDSKIVFECQV